MNHFIVFFDGVCSLCQGSVQFILKRDHKRIFHFSSLQSETASNLLPSKLDEVDSIILLQNDTIFTHSTAALKIAKELRGIWPLLYVFIIVPKPIRDVMYKWIAKRRYRWFGKTENCMLPKPEWKDRFL
ncbi:thiol-disulfide oxidoreductase DCC family protein [Bacillus sp. 2205SS5-2]|uniref:thiol-disulfide oxidoreductase DCC family protein n=1 Tax=Bacillus sp. 2205SS5-2 TaxID=3109031 RepID=UPI003006A54D